MKDLGSGRPAARRATGQGRAARLRSALADERGGRVVFLSHCLLNENTRYLGGAFRAGAVLEVAGPYLRAGEGICQLPCPEQAAWGGVGKRYLVFFWGRPLLRPLAARVLPAFVLYTRLRYRALARRVAAQVADYRAAGIEVTGIVGAGTSPSCGVATTVDLAAAVGPVVGCPLHRLTRDGVNQAIAAAARPGQGIFISELRRALRRRGLDVPFLEHDMRSEWPGSTLTPGTRRPAAPAARA